MKNLFLSFVAIIVFVSVLYAGYSLKNIKEKVPVNKIEQQQESLLGGDKDEHGCIGSAGYSWCEEKQKCLRIWEEECTEELGPADNEEDLKVIVKELIIAKHGPNSESLDITVSKLDGDYAQGGASEAGLGGGMWFAAKVEGQWELVWDGNGIIECDDLSRYSGFPTDMIPQCYDTASQAMLDR